jgi:hypothetical protein
MNPLQTYPPYLHNIYFNIVTYRPVATQRLGKHIPTGANARNRTPIARNRISKHASVTTEAVFSAWSLQSGYKEVLSSTELSEESSFGTTACRDMSLGAEELNWVESSQLAAAEWQERKASRVIWSYSETVINPLPGYD